MKKIIAFVMFAIMMMCALTTVALAEEATIETVVQDPPVTEPVSRRIPFKPRRSKLLPTARRILKRSSLSSLRS